MRDEVIIYTDGACSGNPGPGGWGSVVLSQEDHVQELGGRHPSTTNNQMELTASIEALKYSLETIGNSSQIVLFTDSVYVIRGITQWVWAWKRRNWLTAENNPVANKELWIELMSTTQNFSKKILWKYSRGHIGIPGNERCDKIAVAFSQNEFIQLYSGSLKNYNVDLLKFPENSELPEMKSKPGEKKQAYSYLSLIGGIVYRHQNWANCEKRVKGQSGAKFKKAMTSDEEADILASWGFAGDIKED